LLGTQNAIFNVHLAAAHYLKAVTPKRLRKAIQQLSDCPTALGQKIEAEKNGDTVLIRGSPVGRGDYDL
jgi:hypothetical protein